MQARFLLVAGAALAATLCGCPLNDGYFVDQGHGGSGEGGSDAGGMGGMGGAGTSGANGGANGGAQPDGAPTPDASNDRCPNDANKIDPGRCGCGFPETALCLVHRYSFDGTGTSAGDSIGGATAAMVNCSQADGGVAMSGAGQYVELPDGILSALDSGTVEVWSTWSGGASWQRIFDFGSSSGALGAPGASGTTYLYLTPGSTAGRVAEVAYTELGYANEIKILATAPVPAGTMSHAAVVADTSTQTLAFYLNGALVGAIPFSGSFSHLTDVNNWLGRSQFSADPYFVGSIQELRIFSVARTAAQILASVRAGPDALPSP